MFDQDPVQFVSEFIKAKQYFTPVLLPGLWIRVDYPNPDPDPTIEEKPDPDPNFRKPGSYFGSGSDP